MKPNRFTYRLIVNRSTKRLTVQRLRGLRYETVGAYPCAVGAIGHDTPGGVYKIRAKKINPDWWVPNSPWAIEAGLTPGDMIKGGADENPIKVAFLQITKDPTGNIGIHGTAAIDSLGTAASHGCIRVAPDVAKHLYLVIPRFTRVEIL